ncbi:MAG: hypothetical protein Q9162_000594 [Coniocarpon cinnabarinum]
MGIPSHRELCPLSFRDLQNTRQLLPPSGYLQRIRRYIGLENSLRDSFEVKWVASTNARDRIASPTINGVPFDLAYGLNGNVKVYSFVAHSRAATNFNGDILAFYKYLVQNYASNGFTNALVLQSLQAGSEVFTGSNAKLTTSGYTISAS